MQSLRVLLALASQRGAHLHQLDVKTAFLYGALDEELYMEQPPGQQKKGEEELVCKLKHSIYGLKQSPRQWYHCMSEFLQKFGLVQLEADHAIYVWKEHPTELFLGLYVDDLLIGSTNMELLTRLKEALSSRFEMKDMGAASYILGIRIFRSGSHLFMSQSHYVKGILQLFGMAACHGSKTPCEAGVVIRADDESDVCEETVPYREAIGSLMYLTTSTRPDLATSVSMLSSFLEKPRVSHWQAVKRVFRYLAETVEYGLRFDRQDSTHLIGFSDADWAGDVSTRKSRSGFIFVLGGAAVSWQSRLQDIVTLSTAEAEYVAATEAGKESVWLGQLLFELGETNVQSDLYLDNQSAIKIAKNPVFHRRTKHIDVRYHKIREWVAMKKFDVKFVRSIDMAANFLTKNVDGKLLAHNRNLVGLVSEKAV